MASLVGVLAIGLIIIVFFIALFSLAVLVIIPIGKYLERRHERSLEYPRS